MKDFFRGLLPGGHPPPSLNGNGTSSTSSVMTAQAYSLPVAIAPMRSGLAKLPASSEAQAPAVVMCDLSPSMQDNRGELVAGIRRFCVDLSSDALAAQRAWVQFAGFNDRFTEILPFGNIDPAVDVSLPPCSGSTRLFSAFIEGIRRVEEQRTLLQSAGLDTYRGLVVVLTDGANTGDLPGLRLDAKKGVQAASALPHQLGITTVSVAIGKDADRATLTDITGKAPLEVDGPLGFAQLFSWLVRSLTRVAHSRLTDDVQFDDFNPAEGE